MDTTQLPDSAVEVDGKAMAQFWCLQTVSMKEFSVGKALEQLGIGAYIPAYQARDQSRFFSRLRIRPLFPTYLFSKPIPDDAHIELKRLLGVRSWIEYIGKVDLAVIESLRNREDESGLIRLYDDLAPGDVVEITDGMCAGHVAPVRRILYGETSADERVVILLSMLGREHEITIERSQVRRAS